MNRQKFLAELAKLLSFMYEEDRRYALDMYERMFNIAGEDEQWLIQNLMSPTRQAVIIARAYDAKERSLTVSAHWKEDDGYEDESDETPPFVLAINKIFDDLFPEEEEAEEEAEEQDLDPGSLSPEKEDEPKEQKKNKMPRAAVLLSSTQEFDTITKQIEEAVLSELSEKEDQEDDWDDEYEAGFDETDEETDAVREPDPRVNVIDRAEAFDLSEENPAQETADEPEEEKQAEHAAGSEAEAAAGPILEPETEKNKAEDIISNPEIPEENADGRRSPKSVPLFEEEDREPLKQMEEPTPEEQPAAAEQPADEPAAE